MILNERMIEIIIMNHFEWFLLFLLRFDILFTRITILLMID